MTDEGGSFPNVMKRANAQIARLTDRIASQKYIISRLLADKFKRVIPDHVYICEDCWHDKHSKSTRHANMCSTCRARCCCTVDGCGCAKANA